MKTKAEGRYVIGATLCALLSFAGVAFAQSQTNSAPTRRASPSHTMLELEANGAYALCVYRTAIKMEGVGGVITLNGGVQSSVTLSQVDAALGKSKYFCTQNEAVFRQAAALWLLGKFKQATQVLKNATYIGYPGD
ncbi:MAG TPA: hypothetical protein VF292_07500 [Rhodanobacteraceae bacterium]